MKKFAILLPLLLILLGLHILWNHTPGSVRVDLGSEADKIWITGFNQIEQSDFIGRYRWSGQFSTIQHPVYRGPLIVHLSGYIAPDIESVQFALNQRETINLVNPHSEVTKRNFNLFVPQSVLQNDQSLKIDLTAIDQATDASDQRDLGMLLEKVTLSSTKSADFALLPLSTLLSIIILYVCAMWLLTGLNIYKPLFISIISVIIFILGIFTIRYPTLFVISLPTLITIGIIANVVVVFFNLIERQSTNLTQKIALIILLCLSVLQTFSVWHFKPPAFWDIVQGLAPIVLFVILLFVSNKRIFWLIYAIFIGFSFIRAGIYIFERDYATDFTAYFRASRAFLKQNAPLYDLSAIQTNHLGDSYKYPPFFVFFMQPLVNLAYSPAIQLWRGFNLFVLFGAVLILLKAYNRTVRHWSTWLLMSFVVLFQPITDSLRYAQTDILVLFFLAIALYGIRKQRWHWAGLSLAIPIVMKLYPAYLLLHVVRWRQWKAVGYCIGGCIIATLLSIAFFGWDVHWQFVINVLPRIGGGTAWVENQTLNGWLNRLATPVIALQPDQPGLIRWLTYAGLAIGTTLTYRVSNHLQPAEGFSLWIIAMLALLPATWIHYFVVLLIPMYQILVRMEHQQATPPRRIMLLYLFAWVLLMAGNQWTLFDRTYYGVWWAQIMSYKWYGLLGFWLALALDPQARQDSLNVQAEPSEAHDKQLITKYV